MQCWYCGETDMSPETDGTHEYLKCPNCGATHTELPRPSGGRAYGLDFDRETDMRIAPVKPKGRGRKK